ncbi:MAG: sugar ABC transporter substrate-binding protein [Burkholderiales bacterium]|nr:sugar ABC transporter substrate-binding protein [Burkholderiales bacterium]
MHFFRLISTTLCGLGLVACGQSSGPSVNSTAASNQAASTPAISAPPARRIGLVMKTLTNPFFIEMEKGARKAEKDLGVALVVKTAAQETSIEQQIQLVNDLVADKVDAIVIAPGDSQRLVPTLKKAADAGIKIINIDNRLDPEALKQAGMSAVPFVSVDNDAGAYKAGKFMAESATRPTQAAILEGIRSADNARQRMEGAKRALLENKSIQLVASETANWKIDEAYAVSRTLFKQHPDIQLLFAANDMMALGAVKYLQEAGKTQVKVVGYDALAEALAEIKSGHLLATVDQQAAEQGYQGVVLAVRLLQGKEVPAVTMIDTRLVTAATLH